MATKKQLLSVAELRNESDFINLKELRINSFVHTIGIENVFDAIASSDWDSLKMFYVNWTVTRPMPFYRRWHVIKMKVDIESGSYALKKDSYYIAERTEPNPTSDKFTHLFVCPFWDKDKKHYVDFDSFEIVENE